MCVQPAQLPTLPKRLASPIRCSIANLDLGHSFLLCAIAFVCATGPLRTVHTTAQITHPSTPLSTLALTGC